MRMLNMLAPSLELACFLTEHTTKHQAFTRITNDGQSDQKHARKGKLP